MASLDQVMSKIDQDAGGYIVPAIRPELLGSAGVASTPPPKSEPTKTSKKSDLSSVHSKYMDVYGGSEKSKEEKPDLSSVHAKYMDVYGAPPSEEGAESKEAPFMAQVGRGASETYQGIKELALQTGAKLGVGSKENADKYSKDVMEEKEFYEKNNPTFQAGRLLGNMAAVPVMPSSYAGLAGAGAVLGASNVRPSQDYFSGAAKDAVIGAVAGPIVKGAVEKVAAPLVQKAVNTVGAYRGINAEAAAARAAEAVDVPESSLGRRLPLEGREEPTSVTVTGKLPWGDSEPEVKEGLVRLYHGGSESYPKDTKGLWFTSDKNYAKGYADRAGDKGKIHYSDVPKDHPLAIQDAFWPDQSIEKGFHTYGVLEPKYSNNMTAIEKNSNGLNSVTKEPTADSLIRENLDNLKSKITSANSRSIDEVSQRAAQGDERAARVLKEITSDKDADSMIRASGNLELYNRKATAGEMFDKAEEMAGSKNVKLTSTLKDIDILIREAKAAKLPDTAMIKTLETVRGSIAPRTKSVESLVLNSEGAPAFKYDTPNLTDNSYGLIRDLRSNIGSKLESLYSGENGLVGTSSSRVISKLKESIEKDLTNFTDSQGGELAKVARKANQYYKDEVVPYKTTQMAKALKDAPEDEIRDMFIKQGKEGRAQQFYDLLEPRGQAAVRFGIVNDAADFAKDYVTGLIDPTKFSQKLASMDSPTKAFFKGSDYQQIKGLQNLMAQLGERATPAADQVGVKARGKSVTDKANDSDHILKFLLHAKGVSWLLHTKVGSSLLSASSDLSPKSKAMANLVSNVMTKALTYKGNSK